MIVEWSPRALGQLESLIGTICENNSLAVALKWQAKIDRAVAALEDFPLIGTPLPRNTYRGVPSYFENLRQIVVPPYRIVYAPGETRCEILFCQRCARLLAHP